jgi:hypothetical protein
MRVYMHMLAISKIGSKLNMRNLFGVIYRDSLNILIVYGKCTGTFG